MSLDTVSEASHVDDRRKGMSPIGIRELHKYLRTIRHTLGHGINGTPVCSCGARSQCSLSVPRCWLYIFTAKYSGVPYTRSRLAWMIPPIHPFNRFEMQLASTIAVAFKAIHHARCINRALHLLNGCPGCRRDPLR